MTSRFPIFTPTPRQSYGRTGRSVRRTSSVTTPTASSSTAAGSTKAVQLRLARGRSESLSRPCVRLRPPVWRRLIKRHPLAARSNGRTHRTEPLLQALTIDAERILALHAVGIFGNSMPGDLVMSRHEGCCQGYDKLRPILRISRRSASGNCFTSFVLEFYARKFRYHAFAKI